GGVERLRVSSAGLWSGTLGSEAGPAWANLSDTDTGLFVPAADTLAFALGGIERMRLDSSQRLAVGTLSANFTLSVEANVAGTMVEIDNSRGGGKEGLRLRFSGDAVIPVTDRFMSFYNSAGEVGSVTGEVVYNTFTGGHEGQTDDDIAAWRPGMILSATGQALTHGMARALAKVRLASGRGDAAVIGVFTEARATSHEKGMDPARPLISYNALGDGLVLVLDSAGNLEPGDYIACGPVPGYGERQEDDRWQSTTVAKATERVDWSAGRLVEEEAGEQTLSAPGGVSAQRRIVRRRVEPFPTLSWNGRVYRCHLAACTYHCG
ncbi:MAG: hypothetical protein HY719_17615, partial [Planctomycetes bacterium]|nr:hypothetical protein [Planctomycetota bacterium]